MDDITYTLVQTNRDRKILSRNAKYKRNGSKSRKVTLPSDHLTPAQKRRLNGTVQTYDMNQPHTRFELKLWPEDLLHEYMQNVLDRYAPTNRELCGMLQYADSAAVSKFLKENCGISRPVGGSRRKNADQVLAWRDFIQGTASEPEPESTVEPEPATTTPPVTPRTTLTYESISLTFTGTVDDLIRVMQTGPIHLAGTDTYTFTISARKEVN